MVNAWSLAYEELNGTMDETYPIKQDVNLDAIANSGGFEWTPGSPWPPVLELSDDIEHSKYWYEYDRNDLDMPNPFSIDPLSDNDDQIAHHINLNNEGQNKETMTDNHKQAYYYKYHENEILDDIEEYVSGTYRGHYTGTTHEYRNVQTLDLMASRDLAPAFCQANVLKYASRYGSKNGKDKKDLLKVIHYAMLLLHFDEHYGKPSMTSGNIDHTMP
tara:strand:+ start:850 stop:1500 length:651 start_codon:yes stop_codon:yes gene_type:complete